MYHPRFLSSRDRGRKKNALLPMSLPALEELLGRWRSLENIDSKTEDQVSI